MSDHLRGYVLDCGFLVFGCGEMVAADDVQSVVNYATKDHSPCFIVTLKLDCGGSGDDGGDLWLAPMSPDQERNYRPMASVDDGSTFVAAEASTGCEPEDCNHRACPKAPFDPYPNDKITIGPSDKSVNTSAKIDDRLYWRVDNWLVKGIEFGDTCKISLDSVQIATTGARTIEVHNLDALEGEDD